MRNPVVYKMMFGRVMSYMAYLQFPMIVYLFVVQTGFDLLSTIFLILAGCAILAVFDWKYVFPIEKRLDSTINPQWNEMMGRLKDIRYEQSWADERISGIYNVILNIEARIPRVYGKKEV